MPAPPTKLKFEDFLKTCTPILRIADLEDEMRKRVEDIVQSLLGFQHSSDEDLFKSSNNSCVGMQTS
jgi:hypothetical protein